MCVLRGFLPLFFFACFFGAVPLMFLYIDYDYTKEMARVGTGVIAATVGILILGANDCLAWYNFVLFFHLGLEVKLMDDLLALAQKDGTAQSDMAMCYLGFAFVLTHLLPFFLVDYVPLLSFLAYAGLVVNTIIMLYVDSTLLLLYGLSSTALLAAIFCVGCSCKLEISMLSQLREAMYTGRWLRIETIAM